MQVRGLDFFFFETRFSRCNRSLCGTILGTPPQRGSAVVTVSFILLLFIKSQICQSQQTLQGYVGKLITIKMGGPKGKDVNIFRRFILHELVSNQGTEFGSSYFQCRIVSTTLCLFLLKKHEFNKTSVFVIIAVVLLLICITRDSMFILSSFPFFQSHMHIHCL